MRRAPVPAPPRGARAMRPVLTKHARERCTEMKVPAETVIDIVYNADLSYGPANGRVAKSSAHPEYAVVYNPEDGTRPPRIITVVFATDDDYDRAGTTFVPREDRA